MNIKYTCGYCKTETIMENVEKMKKFGCPVCGKHNDLSASIDEAHKPKKQILKG
jgi:transcription elongation factor Elf1